jgi:release factor glutamine methyltransferase
MALRHVVYELCVPILGTVARSRWLIRRLFQVDVPPHITVHFDPTTVLLLFALRREVTPEDKTALEMGIGQGALVSLALHKATGIDVQGVDRSEARVRSSQDVATHNSLQLRFFVSDLFSAVAASEQFDIIFFNPPYVPTAQGRRLKLTRRMRADSDRVWDGGDDGSCVIELFLQHAHNFLTPRGRVLVGAQPIFLPAQRIEELAAKTRWTITQQVSRCCIPSRVYVLRPGPGAGPQIATTVRGAKGP